MREGGGCLCGGFPQVEKRINYIRLNKVRLKFNVMDIIIICCTCNLHYAHAQALFLTQKLLWGHFHPNKWGHFHPNKWQPIELLNS